MATLFSPSRALIIFLRGVLRRMTCKHDMQPDELIGYSRCTKCQAWEC